MPDSIKAQPLTAEAYASYGNVIAATPDRKWRPANFGRAKRYDFLADVANLRNEQARLNLCIFRLSAVGGSQLTIDVLEKHPLSTQVFTPMHDGRFITIVALGGDQPDLNTLKAFIVNAPEGISYNPGVWHYPMTALGKQLDLACLIYENGSQDDCVIAELPTKLTVTL